MIASRQEILITYLCVITTVALVLLWSWSRDCIDAARGVPGQSEPAPSSRGASALTGTGNGEFGRTSSDARRLPQRASHGMREPAFSRSASALTGTGNGEFGRTSSDTRMRARRESGHAGRYVDN
jgi:hypothetical protein